MSNECLCSQVLATYGVSTAQCEMQPFGAGHCLAVKRFDRRLDLSGSYWLRLPMDDLCQATASETC